MGKSKKAAAQRHFPNITAESGSLELSQRLETLDGLETQGQIRDRVNRLAPTSPSAKRPRTSCERFIEHIVKSYTGGVPTPLFTSGFPEPWPRFKRLWDKVSPG